jgi:hypothetical protein
MRNGVVAAIYADEGQEAELRLIDCTVLHGIITHYAPLPVITCVVHSLLIRYVTLSFHHNHHNHRSLCVAPQQRSGSDRASAALTIYLSIAATLC